MVAAELGLGHLRAARPLAAALGVPTVYADRVPLCEPHEQRMWEGVRQAYRWGVASSQLPVMGRSMRRLVDAATMIPPLYMYRDFAGPSVAARSIDAMIRAGLGRRLIDRLQETGAPLLTTFYLPAIVADRAGVQSIFCVVTDADVSRIWAPCDPRESRIRYLVPSPRVVRRLRSIGVPREHIAYTGFPLPPALVGGEELGTLRRTLAARLVRLDPKGRFRAQAQSEELLALAHTAHEHEKQPPLVTITAGAAGSRAGRFEAFVPAVRHAVVAGAIRLALVAGVRADLARRYHAMLRRNYMDRFIGRGIEILIADHHEQYFDRFDELLSRTDVLWTRPNELVFYTGLGLPLIVTPPVGVHERFNRRFALEEAVAVKQRRPAQLPARIHEWLKDGTLAAAAWRGYLRMPKFGTERILEQVAFEST